MTLRAAIVLCFLPAVLTATINSRLCLDDCLCVEDEANPVIGCESGTRTQLQLPSQPLYGFTIIGFACNDLRSLPSVELLRAAFPDLKAIDIEGNPNFNCSQLESIRPYISVKSDCGVSEDRKFKCLDPHTPSECDWKCRTLEKVKTLWKKFKDVVSNKAKELELDQMFQSAQNWFQQALRNVQSQFDR